MRSLLLLLLTFLVGCESRVTAPDEGELGEQQGLPALFFDRLAVAVVPSGQETIVVQGSEGTDVSFSAEIADPSVASIVVTDADIVVTGEALGSTVLTTTDAEGSAREIPIRVYDPIEGDFGEILLRFWTDFSSSEPGDAVNEAGLRGFWVESNENRYYHPNVGPAGDGWYALGSMVVRTGELLEDKAVLLAKADVDADPANPPLMLPESYEPESWYDSDFWTDPDGPAQTDPPTAYYRPVPRAGYRAMGQVMRFRDDSPPRPDEVAVVREDLVRFGTLRGSPLRVCSAPGFDDIRSGICHIGPLLPAPSLNRLVDDIRAVPVPSAETTFFPVGSFNFYPEYVTEPEIYGEIIRGYLGDRDAEVNVLKLELPLIVESDEQNVIPKLNAFRAPLDQTLPVLSRAILVPYTMITDPEYAGRPDWQLVNSPFYRLEREVYWKLLYYNHNQTSVTQENQVEIVSGTIESESESFFRETGVSVSKGSGIDLGYGVTLEYGGTTNVSRKLGYATATNIQELREERTTTTVFTAPGRAAAMWQKFNRFTLKRHTGTNVEVVSVYEIGINEFVTDDFGGT